VEFGKWAPLHRTPDLQHFNGASPCQRADPASRLTRRRLIPEDAVAAVAVARNYLEIPPKNEAVENLIGRRNRSASTSRWLGPEIGCAVKGVVIRVDVYDTGVEVPRGNQLTHIFDAFKYLTPSVGNGLASGLSIVLGALQVHGHRIEVRSTVGEGGFSRSSCLLPAR
jgi:signal transduction histidine kinase